VAAHPAFFAVHHNDLAMVSEIDSESAEQSLSHAEHFYLDSGRLQGIGVSIGQSRRTGPVVEKVNPDTGLGFADT